MRYDTIIKTDGDCALHAAVLTHAACACRGLWCPCVTVDVIGHDEVVVRSHFCRDFLYLEMYSLHPPSVTVNCVDCYRSL